MSLNQRIQIRVIGAKGLKAADKNGLSDPYVILTAETPLGLQVKELRTPIQQKTLTPEWNATFEFRLRDATKLVVAVMDADVIGKDDAIGGFDIDLATWPQGQEVDTWFPVQRGGTGEVHMAIRIIDGIDGYDSDQSDDGHKGFMKSMAERSKLAASGVSSPRSALEGRIDKLLAQNQDLIEKHRQTVKDFAKARELSMAAIWDEAKVRMRKVLADQVGSIVGKAVDKAGGAVKRKIKDKTMPKFVARGVDSVVDDMIPDVKEEVVGKVITKIRAKEEVDHGQPLTWCFNPFPKIRALILYTRYPFDKTIWENLRNPFWYFLVLLSIFPRYGVSQAWFLFLLLIKDKRDEYQLVDFILSFKGMQFVSVGSISAFIGAFRYWRCVNGSNRNCIDDGPNVEYWELGFFVLQIILSWAAFALLPYSYKKGAARLRLTSSEKQEMEAYGSHGCCGGRKFEGRGGSLRRWVYYDTFLFACLVVAYIAYALVGPYPIHDKDDFERNEWRVKADLYWMRTIYGLLSFPFFFFKMPVVSSVLTHAKPTGYNRNGKTVPVNKRKPWTDSSSDDDEPWYTLGDDDTPGGNSSSRGGDKPGMFSRFKNSITGGKGNTSKDVASVPHLIGPTH